ncbi:MAG: hypothetical protein V1851_01075 [Patescibacteria group bacterium]
MEKGNIAVIKFDKGRDNRDLYKSYPKTTVVLGRRENHKFIPREREKVIVEVTGELPAVGRKKRLLFTRVIKSLAEERKDVVEGILKNEEFLQKITEDGKGEYKSPLGFLFRVEMYFAYAERVENTATVNVSTAIRVEYKEDRSDVEAEDTSDIKKEVTVNLPPEVDINRLNNNNLCTEIMYAIREVLKREEEEEKKRRFKKLFLSDHPEMEEALMGIESYSLCMKKVREMGYGETQHHHFSDGVKFRGGYDREDGGFNEFSISVGGKRYTMWVP